MFRNPIMAIINLNEDHIRKNDLILNRPLATLPIAGRYRLIDFILSNITAAGITNVGIFAQRKIRSLNDHIGDGSTWDLDRLVDGLYIFSNRYELNEKQAVGDIQNVFENIDFIERSNQEYILVTNPYFIFTINFDEVLDAHISSQADITALYKTVENADVDFYKSTVYNVNNGKISSIGKNMCSSNERNISMGCYLLNREKFLELMYSAIETGQYNYLDNMLQSYMLESECNLYRYNGFLKAVTDIKSYREFNNALLDENIGDEIFQNPNVQIYTKTKDEAPTFFDSTSDVKNSIVASGCIIQGKVKNSIIARKVIIEKDAVVENSILLQNTVIGEGAYINNVITDKNVTIQEKKKLIGDINMPIIIKKGETI